MATAFKPVGDVAKSNVTDQVRKQLESNRKDWGGFALQAALLFALVVALLALVALLWQVFIPGTQYLVERGVGGFITSVDSSRGSEYGIINGLRGTFWIGLFVIVLAFPLGIGAAIYLEEYASDSKLRRFIELNIRNLAGVPSVVYGVLGLSIFVKFFDGFFPSTVDETLGSTTAAAGVTLAVLVLPIVIITSSEAIRAVPRSLREAGFGVGATQSEVIRHHVLPYAAPGILTGTLLSLARALGEAAPLILVGGVMGSLGTHTGFFDPGQLGERFTAMPLEITKLAKKPATIGNWTGATAAAIIVLLVLVFIANIAAVVLRNRFEKRRGG